nr:cytochrome c oxidase assembly protein [Lysinibacillus timonensis]
MLKQFTIIKFYSKQPLLFYLALCIIYLLLGTPLSTISHFSFSLHMLQMSILYFIVTPLLLTSIPESLFEKIIEIPMIKRTGQLLIAPRLALYIFSILFLIYHLPLVLNFLTQSPFMKNGYLFILFILSFSIWWPIVSPNPFMRIYDEQKKRYLFLSGLMLMPACIVFILSALVVETHNPFLNQLAVQLCIPPDINSINLFPFPYSTKMDQFIAAVLMLGIHKFSLFLFSRRGNNSHEKLLCN